MKRKLQRAIVIQELRWNGSPVFRVQLQGKHGTVLFVGHKVQCRIHKRNTITSILEALQ